MLLQQPEWTKTVYFSHHSTPKPEFRVWHIVNRYGGRKEEGMKERKGGNFCGLFWKWVVERTEVQILDLRTQ